MLGALGLGAYVLLWPEVMTAQDGWSALLVVGQCLLLAWLLGQFRSPAFAFLYSRGYSRDVLWGHKMLASTLSIVAGWLPAALIVWTGLRSAARDHLFQSPYFPVMAPFETSVPLSWLGLYLLLTPAFHYAWIRLAHPSKGGNGGYYASMMLLFALVMASITANSFPAISSGCRAFPTWWRWWHSSWADGRCTAAWRCEHDRLHDDAFTAVRRISGCHGGPPACRP